MMWATDMFSAEAAVLWELPAAASLPVDGACRSDQSVYGLPGSLQTFLSQYYPSAQQSDHVRYWCLSLFHLNASLSFCLVLKVSKNGSCFWIMLFSHISKLKNITGMYPRFMADYVILHATEPVTQSPVWRALSHGQYDQMLFEERHLRYISTLGKVSLHSTACT